MTSVQVVVEAWLQELIPRFLEGRKADVATLRSALGWRDYATVRRIGHNLKGMGGAYGFAELSRLGAILESAALARDADTALALTDQLAAYLASVTVVYR